ncbi:hypothetical protein [Rasiella sp. SM2506]|uniref:hypothetical protein n=1 Tax=Rasiella sp. SM2506 TaxID=3423914 RepID=UPI003D7B7930
MIYYLQSKRPEIKLSEVTLKKILTDADINFKFLVLKDPKVAHTSEIACVNLQLNVCMYTNEEKLTFKGEKSAMVKIVSLVRDYYGSLSDFTLSTENDEKSLKIAGNTSDEKIDTTF